MFVDSGSSFSSRCSPLRTCVTSGWRCALTERSHGQNESTMTQGLPLTMYLITYDIISCHYKMQWWQEVDWQLWKPHAVTGPCRALTKPVAFFWQSLFSVRLCLWKKQGPSIISYDSHDAGHQKFQNVLHNVLRV